MMKPTSTAHKPMAPIDPLQLLKALQPLLSSDGGIKGTEEVGRLSSLMKKFSRKLVSRCVYVNVLRVSKPETVELFLQKGGWETIYNWLREARDCDNSCFMLELLRLYATLPMTVERLKENDSAKIIKLLMKNGRDDVRAVAVEVIDSWIKLVKGDPNATMTKVAGAAKDNSATSKKKKALALKEVKPSEKRQSPTKKDSPKQLQQQQQQQRKRDKDPAASPKVPSLVIKKDADTLKAVPASAKPPTEPNHGHSNSKLENNRKSLSATAKEDLEDVKLPDYIRLPNEPKSVAADDATTAASAAVAATSQLTRGGVKGERKKSTVKTYRSKMRSVGLEEPTPLPKLVIKKSSKDKTLPPPLPPSLPLPLPSKTSLKRLGSSAKDVGGPTLPPPLKKPKPPALTLSASGSERPAIAGAKSPSSPSASPTAKPPDAAAAATDQASQLRREIKLIAPRPKPATHVLTESAGFMDALVAGPVAPIRKKKKLGGPPTTAAITTPSMSPSKATAPSMPSPPITAAPKLQFYKDTLDIPEESNSSATNAAETNGSMETITEGGTIDTDREPRRLSSSSMDEDASAAAVTSAAAATAADNDDAAGGGGDQNFTSRDTPLSPDAKDDGGGLDALARSLAVPKKKKRVTWAEESDLKQIHFFELDETERVNVNNVKNFGDMKTLERLKERQAVESARRMTDNTVEERKPWLLIPIDLPCPLIVPGSNSLERDVQSQREDSVLQEIFFSKDSIPDAPHEADPEVVEPEETKIIPLIDENNPNAIVDYSTMEMPAPVSSLPSALSNLVMSLSCKTNTDVAGLGMVNSQQPVDIPGLGELPPPPNHMAGYPPGMPMRPMGPMGPMGPPPPPMGYPMGPMDYYNGPRGPMYPPNYGPCGMPPGPNMVNHNEPPPPPPPQQMRNRSGRGGFGPMRSGGGGGNDGGRGGGSRNNHGQSGVGGGGHGHGPYQRGNRGGNHNKWNKGERNKNYYGNGGGGGGGNKGGGGGGGVGGRPRTTLCRHFVNGTCKYGENCTFLHPGINGPPL